MFLALIREFVLIDPSLFSVAHFPFKHDNLWDMTEHFPLNKTKQNRKKAKQEPNLIPSFFFGKIDFMFTVLQDLKMDITPRTGFVTFMRKFHCVTNGAVPG